VPAQGAFARVLPLISGLAGFGRTTKVSDWIRSTDGVAPPVSVGWLSLDEGNNDPARFLPYVVAALQAAEPPSRCVPPERSPLAPSAKEHSARFRLPNRHRPNGSWNSAGSDWRGATASGLSQTVVTGWLLAIWGEVLAE
jgi:hypothetical protein